ncbi:MAG: glycosyltransferase family 2 protein [Deltaproteobacteria bacterium]|nr:glycosyltransferase family 2 protein [Deltaproteobacteria bacterium]
MSDLKLKSTIAFLVFNRPETTIRVFEEIRRARPPKLLVVADGPCADRQSEVDKCQAVRAIIDTVDWPCEVLKNYSDVNLGCKIRVSSGLNWVFDQVEEAIILEDDCLPHPTFFRFCEELLERYRDDERIVMISGDNFQSGKMRTKESYYFSRYTHIWGWASWRRAWRHYDVDMKVWPEMRDGGGLCKVLLDEKVISYWTNIFERVYNGEIDTWDYQWLFACLIQNGLSILPNVNLVSNIGFNMKATHTTRQGNFNNMRTQPMAFPLAHPPCVLRNVQADHYTETHHYFIMPLPVKVLKKALNIGRHLLGM